MILSKDNISGILAITFFMAMLIVSGCTTDPAFNFFQDPWKGTTIGNNIEDYSKITVEGGDVEHPLSDEDMTYLKINMGRADSGICACTGGEVSSFTCFTGEYAYCTGSGSCVCEKITSCESASCADSCSSPNKHVFYPYDDACPYTGFENNYCCVPPPPPPPENGYTCPYSCRNNCEAGERSVTGYTCPWHYGIEQRCCAPETAPVCVNCDPYIHVGRCEGNSYFGAIYSQTCIADNNCQRSLTPEPGSEVGPDNCNEYRCCYSGDTPSNVPLCGPTSYTSTCTTDGCKCF